MANLVKIENYDITPVDTFTFPYNPLSFQRSKQSYTSVIEQAYTNFHFMMGSKGTKPAIIIFSGHFSESTKDDDFEEVAHRLNDGTKMFKLYFRDDRFRIVGGTQIQQTNQGGRTNFVDYVFNAISPIPLAFGSTLKTASYNGSTWTSGDLTNGGGTDTYIEEVTFTLSSGVTSSDTVILNSNGISGLTFTFGASYSSGETFTVRMIRHEETAGIYQSQLWECRDSSGDNIGRARSSGKTEQALGLNKGARIDTYTISGTATLSNVTFKFRDGFNGG